MAQSTRRRLRCGSGLGRPELRRAARGGSTRSTCAGPTPKRGRLIARVASGLTHAGVNAELNRVSDIRPISEATVEQLERRLDKAENWLRRASARRWSAEPSRSCATAQRSGGRQTGDTLPAGRLLAA